MDVNAIVYFRPEVCVKYMHSCKLIASRVITRAIYGAVEINYFLSPK